MLYKVYESDLGYLDGAWRSISADQMAHASLADTIIRAKESPSAAFHEILHFFHLWGLDHHEGRFCCYCKRVWS